MFFALEMRNGSEDEANATGESRYIYAFARLNPNLWNNPNMMLYPLLWPNPKNKTHQRIRRRKRKAKRVQKVKKGNKGKNPGSHSTLLSPPNFTPPPPLNGVPSNLPADVSAPTPSAQPAPSPANDGNNSSPVDEFAKKKAERDNEIFRIKALNASKKKGVRRQSGQSSNQS